MTSSEFNPFLTSQQDSWNRTTQAHLENERKLSEGLGSLKFRQSPHRPLTGYAKNNSTFINKYRFEGLTTQQMNYLPPNYIKKNTQSARRHNESGFTSNESSTCFPPASSDWMVTTNFKAQNYIRKDPLKQSKGPVKIIKYADSARTRNVLPHSSKKNSPANFYLSTYNVKFDKDRQKPIKSYRKKDSMDGSTRNAQQTVGFPDIGAEETFFDPIISGQNKWTKKRFDISKQKEAEKNKALQRKVKTNRTEWVKKTYKSTKSVHEDTLLKNLNMKKDPKSIPILKDVIRNSRVISGQSAANKEPMLVLTSKSRRKNWELEEKKYFNSLHPSVKKMLNRKDPTIYEVSPYQHKVRQ